MEFVDWKLPEKSNLWDDKSNFTRQGNILTFTFFRQRQLKSKESLENKTFWGSAEKSRNILFRFSKFVLSFFFFLRDVDKREREVYY